MTPHGDFLIRKTAKVRLVRYKLSPKQVNITCQIFLSENEGKSQRINYFLTFPSILFYLLPFSFGQKYLTCSDFRLFWTELISNESTDKTNCILEFWTENLALKKKGNLCFIL